jgi:hypothetical protein
LTAAVAATTPGALATATATAGPGALTAAVAIPITLAGSLGAIVANDLAVAMALSSLIGEGRRDEAAGDDRGERGRSNTQGQDA